MTAQVMSAGTAETLQAAQGEARQSGAVRHAPNPSRHTETPRDTLSDPKKDDPMMLLMRAIDADARRAGCAVTLTRAASTRWASATFRGARHELTVQAADDPHTEAWLDALPMADLPVRAQLIADLIVKGVTREGGIATINIEALTVGL